MSPPSEAITNPDRSLRAGSRIVLEDLKRFGPEATPPKLSLREAQAYCKSLAKKHYENFSVASWLVPANLRQDLFNIYAYCRWSDDLADELDHSEESLRLLNWWRQELRRCFHQQSSHPVFVALQHTIQKHEMTQEPFEKLLDAFVQDQTVHRYESDSQLFEYCRGSANPVGRMLLQIARVSDPKAELWSDCICTGLQIANFCQDIRQDALRDRIYLPRSRWLDHGVCEQEILQATATKKLTASVRDWVQVARTHLTEGLPLVTLVPSWLARDLQLFVRGGLAILDNIEQAHFDVWGHPIEVTKKQKIKLLVKAIVRPRSTHVSSTKTISKFGNA